MKTKLLAALIIIMSVGVLDAKNCSCIKNGDTWTLPNGDPCPNIIQTAVPFLRIAPDARSTGMGDMGIATSADNASIHYNPAKLAFIKEDLGFQLTYTPWLKALNLNDVFLTQLSAHKRVGSNQTLGMELKYFSLGTIDYIDENKIPQGQGKPNELSLAVAYSRKLSKHLGVGITGKFIYSNLAAGQIVRGIQITAGTSGAADLGVFYEKDLKTSGMNSHLRIGAAITNLGAKMSYSNSVEKEFIPTNLGLGVNYEIEVNEYNKVSFGFDFNKLLVPTPPLDSLEIANYQSPGVIKGIFQSFGDAPSGFSEEISEILVSVGAEYWYDDQFSVRAGYFHEALAKGARNYFTLGMGLKYNVLGLNFSYLIPTDGQQSALNNTLRFSISYDIDNTEE